MNATVFADNIDKGVRFFQDADEVWTKTDPVTGDFTLPTVPTYNYVLVSLGGTDKLTGQNAIQMIAPAGSANITPLTTLVALDTTGTVKAKLEAIMPPGAKFDADISVVASPAILLVSKSVEAVVQSMTNAITTKAAAGTGQTISAAQISSVQAQALQNITQEFAKPSVTPTTLSAPQNLTTSLQTAATATVASINTAGNITIPAATASTIASSAVTATTTALNIVSGTTAATTAMTGGETVALATTAVQFVADVKAATTAAVLTTTATTTQATYTPPPIQVVTPITIAPPQGSQTIGNISFTPAVLNISGTTTVSATATSGLAVAFSSATPAVCSVSGSTVSGLSDGMCIITATQAGNTNYSAAKMVQSYVTIRANQTIRDITINPTTLGVGKTTTASASSSSGLIVTLNSVTPATCTVSETTITGVSTGTCTITADQIGTTGYVSASQVTKNITVDKGEQKITVTTTAPYKATGSFTVAAKSSSGLPVTYSSATPSVCTNKGATFTVIATGACITQYDQPGNANYIAAPQVTNNTDSQVQTISAIKLDYPSIPVFGASTISAAATSGLPVTYTTTTPNKCFIFEYGGGYRVGGEHAGTCTIVANQAGNLPNYSPAVPVTLSFTVDKYEPWVRLNGDPPASLAVGESAVIDATGMPGVSLSYTVGGPCSVSGTVVTMQRAGICNIGVLPQGGSDSLPIDLYNNPFPKLEIIGVRNAQTMGVLSYVLGTSGTATVSAEASTDNKTGSIPFDYLPVTFVSTTPSVCSVDTATWTYGYNTDPYTPTYGPTDGRSSVTVTAAGSGTCTIIAKQAGSQMFSPAPLRYIDILFTSVPTTTGSTGGSSILKRVTR